MEIKQSTRERLHLLAPRLREWDKRGDTGMSKAERLELSLMMAATLNSFVEFAILGMMFLGFSLSDMQADIAEFMAYGPEKAMVSAQRGEAKTTLAALYAVWKIIQDPTTRVMVVSAAGR